MKKMGQHMHQHRFSFWFDPSLICLNGQPKYQITGNCHSGENVAVATSPGCRQTYGHSPSGRPQSEYFLGNFAQEPPSA